MDDSTDIDITNIDIEAAIRNMYQKNRAEKISTIYNNSSFVQNIDNDIKKLLCARNAILNENVNIASTLVGTRHFFNENEDTFRKEYKENRFNSDFIKNAIKQVRILFFDDSKEIFQKYNCVDINVDGNFSTNDTIGFTFSNGERDFTLVIPTYVSYSSEIKSYEILCGGIYIRYKKSEYFIDSTHAFFDINKVRKDILNFVEAKSTKEFAPLQDEEFPRTDFEALYDKYLKCETYDTSYYSINNNTIYQGSTTYL